MALLFKPDMTDPAPWLAALARRMPEREIRVFPDVGPVADIHYALVYAPPPGLLVSLPHLKAIFSLWAGVDHLGPPGDLPSVPVIRMVERSLTASMTAHVVQQVLDIHSHAAVYRARQAERRWAPLEVTVPWKRRVGILGLGALGRDAAEALAALRFDVAGWARTAKQIAGIGCYCGTDGLADLLARSDILVCLLPLTDATRGILSAELFAQLPRGGAVINCARGAHLVEADLLRALDRGQLARAALDVFDQEPLPSEHPFWADPRIVVTPHIAAFSNADTSIESVAANIARMAAGEPPRHRVDFQRGY